MMIKFQQRAKGVLSTYWLNISGDITISHVSGRQCAGLSDQASNAIEVSELLPDVLKSNAKHDLLIEWVCALLRPNIKMLLLKRIRNKEHDVVTMKLVVVPNVMNHIPLLEVADAIKIPDYKVLSNSKESKLDGASIKIDSMVKRQLCQYISLIASSYHHNPFNNFNHTCHVTMSVSKLLTRIINLMLDGVTTKNNANMDIGYHIHDFTYGMHLDPITIIAILLSGIIHDVDHHGVSNIQLMKEQPIMENLYQHQSVAEQNSVNIAWSLFTSDQFMDLHNCLFETHKEMNRFRHVLVNCALATDIMDKELNELRCH
jgi:3'5'-cyclic nucleotide phosphodiesterase